MKTKKMNYVLVPLCLVVLLTLGLVNVHAFDCPLGLDRNPRMMDGSRGAGGGVGGAREMRGGARHLKMLAIALDFTDEQKTQVGEIVTANRAKTKVLRQQIWDGQQQLCGLMDRDTFDEVALRSQAEKVAEARIDLMVNRVKTRQAVFAVMTSAQQEKAKKIQQAMLPQRQFKKGQRGAMRQN